MCGIAGFIDYRYRGSEAVLQAMHGSVQHRGPDGDGTVLLQEPEAQIGFSHRRLAIIDLSEAGRQPMVYKQFTITFNGEIYNYAEIRQELLSCGHQFSSHTDTEVILHAYEQWGPLMVQRFIGMFAFALYDAQKKEVLLFRDRAGVKPLYYYWKDELFLFGSELKSITTHPSFQKEICPQAVQLFFQYGYIRAPFSIYQHCRKLKPGAYMRFSLAKKSVEEIVYWNIADFYHLPVRSLDEEEAIEQTEKLLLSSCQYRMVADVPVGVFLSGGYDSSLVTALLQKNSSQKIKTFTIGFHEARFNEAEHAKKVAAYLGTDHHEYYCTSQEAKDIIPQLPHYYDEPFGDSSAIPTILVSRFARTQVTVALSADGGDELFAGYNRYDQIAQLQRLKNKVPAGVTDLAAAVLHQTSKNSTRINRAPRMQKMAEVLRTKTMDGLSDRLSRHFTRYTTRCLLNHPYYEDLNLFEPGMINGSEDYLRSLLLADYKTYLVDDILTKVDRATMSISLEGREPLLDHRLAEWVAQLPSHLKYRDGCKKYLLKKITWKHLPKELMERPKAGFSVPVNQWMKKDLKSFVQHTLNEKELQQHGLLNVTEVLRIRDSHLQGNRTDQQLWLLLTFQQWWKRWMM